MNGWWYAAGVLFVLSALSLLVSGTRLAAANPSVRLPWFGRPVTQPRGVKWRQVFAVVTLVAGLQFAADGFWRGGAGKAYDVLWGALVAVVVILVGLVPYVRHNHRVGRLGRRASEG